MTEASKDWIEDELAGCRFVDRRLERRLHALLGQMADAMGESIPLACQDWANTKAADRFFAHDGVHPGPLRFFTVARCTPYRCGGEIGEIPVWIAVHWSIARHPDPWIRGLFTACNIEAEPRTWCAFHIARRADTPYRPRGRSRGSNPVGIGPNGPSL